MPPKSPHQTGFLTPENSLVILLDYQPRTTIAVRSMDPQMIVNNSLYLAKVAAALDVPVILSTIHRKKSGEMYPELRNCSPGIAPLDRTTRNAWSDPGFVAAVRHAGRKKLVIAGLLTEVCLCFTVLSALGAGYEAYVVVDASGGTSPVAHDAALQRMMMAGAIPVSVQQVMAEFVEGASHELRKSVVPIIERYAGGFGQMFTLADQFGHQDRADP